MYKQIKLLSEIYQVLGVLNAPDNVMDNVAAAMHGQPMPHKTLLPFSQPSDLEIVQRALEKAGALKLTGDFNTFGNVENMIAWAKHTLEQSS